jgi:hypothetical protein
MSVEKTLIKLTNKEAVFLAALLGENILLGVEDPFLGYLAEQVEAEWMKCLSGMIQKGYISNTAQGVEGLEVRSDIITNIKACCNQRAFLVAYDTEKAESHIFSLTENNDEIVFALNKSDVVEFHTQPFSDFCELSKIIMSELSLCLSDLNDRQSIMLSEETYRKSMTLADAGDFNAASSILQKNYDIQEEQSFFETLLHPERKILLSYGSMQSVPPEIKALGVLVSKSDTLSIHEINTKNGDMLEVNKFGNEDMENVISGLFNSASMNR